MGAVDLHFHSNVSDGLLSPAEVVRRGAKNGAALLALTDHDDLAGLQQAREEAERHPLRFVDGVEVSSSWNETTIHIVGLAVDPCDAALTAGLAGLREGRITRARRMAAELDAVGIPGAFEGAQRHADNATIIGRAHFARYIVERGDAPDVRGVFDRFLVRGKPGYVEHHWCDPEEAIAWIHGAGGRAVLAHPGRYRIGRDELRALLREFKDCGGDAIEVVSGAHSPDHVREFASAAREYGFMASRGSDFHGPGESHVDVGRTAELPEGLTPVWRDLI